MPYPYASPLIASDSPLGEPARKLVGQLIGLDEQSTFRPAGLPDEQEVADLKVGLLGQPQAIVGALEAAGPALSRLLSRLGHRRPQRIYLTGRGEAFGAALALRPLFEEMFGAATEAISSIGFGYYANRPVDANTLVVVIETSGQCVQSIEALLVARARGALTLAVTTPGTILASEAEATLAFDRPTLIGGTIAMALLMRLALDYGASHGISQQRIADLRAAFALLPGQIERETQRLPTMFSSLERTAGPLRFIAEGPAGAAAWTGAELVGAWAGRPAFAGSLEPDAPWDGLTIIVVPNGLSERLASITARRIYGAGRRLWALVAEDNSAFDQLAEHVIRLPPLVERLCAPVCTIPLQGLALELARLRFSRRV